MHNAEAYERFKQEVEEVRRIKSDLDVQIIGSDISIRAIEASSNNLDFANVNRFAEEGVLDVRTHHIINNPMLYAKHWPSLSEQQGSNKLISYSSQERQAFVSLYHGDFEKVGEELLGRTDGFRDFTLLGNIPYGVQSNEK